MFSDLKSSYSLAYSLTKRDISALYRQSLLGYLWAFLIPLINTITWIFLNNSGIIKITGIGMPYIVFVFSGTMMWQIFVEALQAPIQQVTISKPLLAKLNFPREAIILSGIYKTLFNAALKVVILIPIIFIFSISPGWTIIFFPFVILSIVLLGTSTGLILAPIGSLYSDIGRVIPYIGQLLMFFAPVLFPLPKGGLYLKLFECNFMTPLIITGRDFLTGASSGWGTYFLIVNVIAIIVLFVAWIIYRITMPILIERMSS